VPYRQKLVHGPHACAKRMKSNLWILFHATITLQVAALGATETNNPSASPRSKAVPPAIAGPKIEFGESDFNFGKIMSGEIVRHDFVFTNTGTITLDITDVRPGCGCTTAGEWSRRVEPGQSGSIPLQFNSSGFGGEVTKSATVACNDPGQTNIILQIIGTVWKPIEITPEMVVFNLSNDVQTNETKVARITNNLEEPLTLSDLQSTNRSFRAELKTIRPGMQFELHITAVPPFNSPSTMATLSLKTSAPQMPLLSVSAYAMVQQAVTVAPSETKVPEVPQRPAKVPVAQSASPQLRIVPVRTRKAAELGK
jgi:hypothetical protein